MHVSLDGMEGILTARATATGLILTGACHIYWITVCPNNTNCEIELSDGIATGTTKWGMASAIGQAAQFNFSKPIAMETGIYCEVFTSMHAATIGYAIP